VLFGAALAASAADEAGAGHTFHDVAVALAFAGVIAMVLIRLGRPGFNPANPPGFSTHERRNDGVAYPGPRGARLPYWCVGMDWTDAPAVVQAAKAEGYIAVVTYPSNPREGHHINFRREPLFKPLFKPLQRGSRGPRVLMLTRRLSALVSPANHEPYLDGARPTFDAATEDAVRRFQSEHKQLVDGIYGPLTHKQLITSRRRQRRHGA